MHWVLDLLSNKQKNNQKKLLFLKNFAFNFLAMGSSESTTPATNLTVETVFSKVYLYFCNIEKKTEKYSKHTCSYFCHSVTDADSGSASVFGRSADSFWCTVFFWQLHLWASCFTSCCAREQRASIKVEFTNHKWQRASHYAFSIERCITEICLNICCCHWLTSAWTDFHSFHANKVFPLGDVNLFFCNWV